MSQDYIDLLNDKWATADKLKAQTNIWGALSILFDHFGLDAGRAIEKALCAELNNRDQWRLESK